MLATLCLLAADVCAPSALEFDGRALAHTYGLQQHSPFWDTHVERRGPPTWERGGLVLQGFFGAGQYDTFQLGGGTSPGLDGSGDDVAQMPVLGGGGQWKTGGSGVDFGIEGMFSVAGRVNAAAFAFGGGGAVIAVNIDMLVVELFGGPFVSIFLGDDARVYLAGGPMMQWVDYTQDTPSTGVKDDGAGFGTGAYVRAGMEFHVGDGMMIGFGVRWTESTVDLGPSLGDLELEGFQALLTVTEGF